jgi:hypothetical protein
MRIGPSGGGGGGAADPETIDDRVAGLLVAGANVTLDYNDAANSLTIASTAAGGGGGTVISTSVVSANGLAGSVATATTTPAITLTTTVNGVVKGNGTALSAATAGTDYMTPANVSASYQPLDADLTALAGLNATAGLVEQTGAAAFTKRLLGVVNATDVLTRADGDGRYQTVDADLTALAALSTTGMMARTAANTYTMRTITGTASRLSVTNGDGVSGNPTLNIDAAYDALWAPVSHTQTASTITDFSEAVDDRVGALLVAGSNVTLNYNDAAGTLTITSTAAGGGGGTVTDVSVVSANGFAGSVGTSTTTPAITLTTSITGMLKGNGTAISQATAGTDYMTPANVSAAYQPLDATLTAVAAYNTNGLLAQTTADTFAGRTITGTTNRLSVANGNGVSGNPTLNIDAAYDALWLPIGGGTLTGGLTGTTAVFSGAITTNSLTVGYLEVPQNAQTGNYTAVLADAGKHIYHAVGAGAGDTYTIPANSSVAYPIGTTLTFINDDATNAVTIAITSDTMVLSPGTTTGSRTLATGGVATAIKVTSTRWIINGTGLT